MARRVEEPELLTTEEAFNKLNLDHLKPLAALLIPKPTGRKGEIVSLLSNAMRRPEQVRALYGQLDPLAQKAVRHATHDPRGRLHADRFAAHYGQLPGFAEPATKTDPYSDYDQHRRPTKLALFFPNSYHRDDQLPTDLRLLLLDFVPAPDEFSVPTAAALPQAFPLEVNHWEKDRPVTVTEQVPLRVRQTVREAEHDVKAVLRLIEASRVRVTNKKRQPTAASVKAVVQVLDGGDFYTAEDEKEVEDWEVSDLTIKAFAWPMIVQAAGLAEKRGDRLDLTAAGRKALTQRSAEALRAAWKKWRTTTLLDEFSRVEAIKGQGKGRLSALPQRRQAVVDGLAHCPPGQWIAVDDFFRFLRATDRDFVLAHDPWGLYIAEHHYGNFGDEGGNIWELLQGRYILALLFEYVATLGLVDVAYVPPGGVRNDFGDRWGADDYSTLSRYDGLLYFRVNPLGVWCLDLAERYEPPVMEAAKVLRVLPNLDVVASQAPLPAADRLTLDRFAEPQSENVWRLTAAKLLPLLEEGATVDELAEFLKARSEEELPQTVQVFLDDLKQRAGQMRDLGPARLIECRDAAVARLLAADPQLRDNCRLADERWLVFRTADEAAVRRALRRLGYVLPPQRD